MTLIVSCLSQEFVVNVSDRRLIAPDTGEVVEEEATKAVVFRRHFVWSYTGLAALPGPNYFVKTDFWIMERLRPDLNQSVIEIRDDASNAFRRLGLPPSKSRHAFVAVGWETWEQQAPTACLLLISNSLAPDLSWLPEAKSQFEVHLRRLPTSQGFALHEAGQPLLPQERSALVRQIGRALPQGPVAVSRLIAETVVRVAQRNAAVGDRLLVGFIPRAAASISGWGVDMPFHSLGQPETGTNEPAPRFYYVPESDSAEFIRYGPHWTDGSMRIASPMFAVNPPAYPFADEPLPEGSPDRWHPKRR
jgi:hypothetical protein